MSKCAQCGAVTQLFDDGVPICMECAAKNDAQSAAKEEAEAIENEKGGSGNSSLFRSGRLKAGTLM
jgi:hypothetical protein